MDEIKEKSASNSGKEKKDKDSNKESLLERFLQKLLKFLFIALAIAFVLWLIVSIYGKKPLSIYTRVGNKSLVSVSIKDAFMIRAYSIDKYKELAKEGNFEEIYNTLFTDEYKEYVSYDEYLNSIRDIDWDSFNMESIKSKSDYAFEARMVYNVNVIESGEEKKKETKTTYLLFKSYLNDKSFTISPDKYIYGYFDKEIKDEDIKLTVSKLAVFTDKIVMDCTVENTSWFFDHSIYAIDLTYGEGLSVCNYQDIELKKGEKRTLHLEYDNSNYYIPNTVNIKLMKGEDSVKNLYFNLDS
jgi:hypothetical protein